MGVKVTYLGLGMGPGVWFERGAREYTARKTGEGTPSIGDGAIPLIMPSSGITGISRIDGLEKDKAIEHEAYRLDRGHGAAAYRPEHEEIRYMVEFQAQRGDGDEERCHQAQEGRGDRHQGQGREEDA